MPQAAVVVDVVSNRMAVPPAEMEGLAVVVAARTTKTVRDWEGRLYLRDKVMPGAKVTTEATATVSRVVAAVAPVLRALREQIMLPVMVVSVRTLAPPSEQRLVTAAGLLAVVVAVRITTRQEEAVAKAEAAMVRMRTMQRPRGMPIPVAAAAAAVTRGVAPFLVRQVAVVLSSFAT